MAVAYQVRKLRPEDRPAAVALMRRALGTGTLPRSEEFFAWKHQANPFGTSASLVAEADGHLVGLRMFLRWRFRSGAQLFPAVRAVDTATDPAWLRRGIFSRLTSGLVEEVEKDGAALIFNTPNAKSRAGYLKLGWRDVGRVALRLRPLRWTALLRRAPLDSKASSLDLEPIESLWEELDVERLLSERAEEGDRMVTARDEPYLRWRYRDTPGVDYRVLGARGRDAQAALILRLRRRDRRDEVALCEVLGQGPGAGRILSGLLAELVSEARRAGVHYLVAMASPSARQRKVLSRAGFLPGIRIGPRLTVRSLAGESQCRLPMVHAPESWQLSIGDVELF